MEAVLTVIAAATMLGLPTVVLLMLKVISELAKHSLSVELLDRQRQFIFDKPFAIGCRFGSVSALTLLVGAMVMGSPAAFTALATWIWVGLIVTCLITAFILEKRADRMKRDTTTLGGGEVG